MSKVRINDLARELEVKSRVILDILPEVGVTEKKTHSSSVEEDEARRVRAALGRGGKSASSAPARAAAVEQKPKIDLSHISRPGDVLRAIQQQKEQRELQGMRRGATTAPPRPTVTAAAAGIAKPTVSAPAPSSPVASPSGNKPASVSTPVSAAPAAPAAAASPAGSKPAPRKIVPLPRQAPQIVSPTPTPTPAIASRAPQGPVIVKPPSSGLTGAPAVVAVPAKSTPHEAKPAAAAVTSVPPPAPVPQAPSAGVEAPPASVAPTEQPAAASMTPAVASPATPASAATTTTPATPGPPAKRVIMPQTGPRPIYTAPAGAAQTLGGMQRGKPIFERPRPQGSGGPGGAPYGSRPASGPGMGPGGVRRPMHPTRQHPTGAPGARPGMPGRPGFGAPRPGMGAAPGMAPPAGAGDRPSRGHAQRRGGNNRYEKSKEGPMKGMVAPRLGAAQIPTGPVPITRNITVTDGVSVKDLAEKLELRAKDLIATLLQRGVFVTVNQSLDTELIKEVSRQFGAEAQVISFEDEMANEALENLLTQETTNELEVTRPPVVTIMGHVDHGKTSLLDAIRETEVAAGEAGGITQHIGAYKVRISKEDSPAFGREIVFLDTPGHEAFTRMRARGAKVTDIVVIVVAADDGVMPQTLEAIDHAKAANVPIIVAVNKIDKPDAQPDRVKQQLGDRGLVPESWGGSTVFVDVSAKKRINLDLLLEMICLVADVGTLRASPDRPALGTVIESKLDRGRGAVSTVLVQNGTLRLGDTFVVGNTFGKVRAMFDDRGRPLTEATPSTPVEILGLESIPDAGDVFTVVADRDKAKNVAQYRKMKERESQLAKSSRVSLEGLAEQIKQAGVKELPIILKGDVQGSVEVLAESLPRLSTEKVRVKVIHSGVGAITESDILLASASDAIVIGFNVRPERKASELATQEGVDIRLHSIIYELQDEMRKAMLGLLEATIKENYLGRAEVANVFKIPKVGAVAGCRVTDGMFKRDSEVRVLRDGVQVYKGRLASLKRFKDDVSEVRNGMECGISIQNFNDIKVGDVLEAFTAEKIAADIGTALVDTPAQALTPA
ncbi:MAG TPA: translation initiation factor IF-2 [Acidobacteriaceae bacterium]|nr:translation initiation factor IF-2 [Acidobacteriaceae bacterium]